MERFEFPTTDDGFEVADLVLPQPTTPVEPKVKDRLALVLCAIVRGATPEEVATYLSDGFPESVREGLERPGEREEMDAHADMLAYIFDGE